MATAYSFEHINFPKAHHLHVDERDLMMGQERPYDLCDNYPSGDGDSSIWTGFAHYLPYNRRWQRHDARVALPNERTARVPLPKDRVSGQMEFVNEDRWRDFQHSRDRPGSKFCVAASYKNIYPVPDLQQSGYAFNPCNLYRTGVPALTLYNPHNPWPKTEIRAFPTWRGPRAYYGYYHEELDVHHNGGYRYPRDPKLLVNDEDIMKYEHMRNVPVCHQKLPVEFPVLM